MNPCPFAVSFLKFAKWQTRRYISFYKLGAANLMAGSYLGGAIRSIPLLQRLLWWRLLKALKVQNQTGHRSIALSVAHSATV